jgi:hypothetical protein
MLEPTSNLVAHKRIVEHLTTNSLMRENGFDAPAEALAAMQTLFNGDPKHESFAWMVICAILSSNHKQMDVVLEMVAVFHVTFAARLSEIGHGIHPEV